MKSHRKKKVDTKLGSWMGDGAIDKYQEVCLNEVVYFGVILD